MLKLYTFVLMLFLLVALGAKSIASEMYFQESIDNSVTYRFTRKADCDEAIWWEETLPGNSEFDLPTDSLSYVHSIEGIDPPTLPGGTIMRARLKLYLRNHSDDDFMLTVDSLNLEHINRRHFLIGPNPDDSISVEQSIFDDGTITVVLKNHDCDDEDDDEDDDGEGDDNVKNNKGQLMLSHSAFNESSVLNQSNDDDDGDDDEEDEGEQFILYRSVLDIIYTPAVPTDVNESRESRPSGFVLNSNYPNPFNPATTIEYTLPSPSRVKIEIFNTLGRVVKTLVNETKAAGSYQVSWTGTNDAGEHVASGMYFYRLQTDDYMETKKMVLLK